MDSIFLIYSTDINTDDLNADSDNVEEEIVEFLVKEETTLVKNE